jgi:hypothetical protein
LFTAPPKKYIPLHYKNAAGRRGAARKGDERRGRRADNGESDQSRRRGRDDWKKFFE